MCADSAYSHPQNRYRQTLLDRARALAPASVLEVGCGGGGFIRDAVSLDANVIGIDPDESAVSALQSEGLDARVGSAEQLEFADQSQDVVVFSYSAHHIANWQAALNEALRVSQNTVLILDPWFDHRIVSQVVAGDFDSWCKSIDRDSGMVHNNCMDAADLLTPLADRLGAFEINLDYQLVLRELGAEQLVEMARGQLDKCGNNVARISEFTAIRKAAQVKGFSGDGAILLSIAKSG
jgi:SAM-dependent methyltransferase